MLNISRTKEKPKLVCGFTLIELMVAVSLFIVVSLISVGALLSMIDANRRAYAFEAVVNNLAFGLEGLSKTMRVGTTYHCRDIDISVTPPPVPPSPGFDTPENCPGGGNFIAFESSGGNPALSTDQIIYQLNGTTIERSINGGVSFLPVTASDMEVTTFRVYVFGAEASPGDTRHPMAIIVVRGFVDYGQNARSEFNIQTVVSQRALDS